MPTYILPQALVFQDFVTTPVAVANALQAHIAGPNGQLIRYAQTSERDQGFLGYYDALNTEVYSWPNRPAGGVIDQTYVKLWVENAILKYFDDNTTCTSSGNYNITSASVNFATNGTYVRDASLGDRDVAIGDIVKTSFATAGSPTIMWSYVAGLVANKINSSISAAVADIDNGLTTSASSQIGQTNGPFNALNASVLNSVSYTNYDPYPTGQTTETYTIIVTQSSVNGDLTTAKLKVISASGLDDVASVVPGADGQYTFIGTHGLKVLFDASGGPASISANDENISPNDFIAGQRWVVDVTGNFTATVATANAGTFTGTYTGTAATTYQVTVVTGGNFATTTPMIAVTTNTGYDVSGPTAVSGAGVSVPVGTKGVTINFAGLGLLEGDRFYIPVTPAGNGPVQAIKLGHNIPSTVPTGTACELQLFIQKPLLQLPQNRDNEAPLTNFDMTDIQLTVHDGATAYDPTWTFSGVPAALPVLSDSGQNYGRLYVETRTWLPTLTGTINSLSDVGLISSIPGQLDPDNPLAWGVFKALTNSNGVAVNYTAVADPTITADWTAVLDVLTGTDQVYGLVPLTRDPTILSLWQAHIDDNSSPEAGLWRVGWFNLSDLPTIPVVSAGSTVPGHTAATTLNGSVALATITADPAAVGTEYTIVTVPAGNAGFITNGVVAGDIVRAQYAGDGFGNFTYQEYVVDIVLTNDALRLLSGPAIAVNVASKLEIWRNLNATDEAAAIAKVAGAYGDRRIRAVWPDTVSTGGISQDGYHLCAALAGLSSGILPQQGMTNLAIQGFDDISRTTRKFNKAQLDSMAVAGTWIVTQAPIGTVYTRHALTTGSYSDLNQREEMVTRNVDSISYQFKSVFAPFIGVANVTPGTVALMHLEATGLIENLVVATANPTLGGQLIGATIVSLQQSALLLDRIVAYINLDLPEPFNNFECHLIV